MKSNVPLAQASNEEIVLPVRVQEALGELVGAAKEGLLALSVGVGLGVLAELMEEEVVEVVGAKRKHDPGRAAVRHGREGGEVTLGGRRLAVERPRVRSADGRSELPLQTYAHFADRDQLSRVVLERMLAGVSTRRYLRTQEPVGSEVEQAARSTSRSAVSRTFVERTRRALDELMSRRLEDVRLAAMMRFDHTAKPSHYLVIEVLSVEHNRDWVTGARVLGARVLTKHIDLTKPAVHTPRALSRSDQRSSTFSQPTLSRSSVGGRCC